MKISFEFFRKLVGFGAARQSDYRLCFGSPAGQRVLMDIARYCAAADIGAPAVDPRTGLVDVNRTLMQIGRHQVFERINNHLHLTPEQIYALYDGREVQPHGDSDG